MYKRNQVEWAIWQALDRGHMTSDHVPASVDHTIRRLIDVDRKMQINSRAPEPWRHRFAFIEGDPQGRGGENTYRLEETVMLWLGIQYLAMGLPQADIIRFLRTLKPQLEAKVRDLSRAHEKHVTTAAQERGATGRQLRTRSFLPVQAYVYVIADAITANGVTSGGPRPDRLNSANIRHGKSEMVDFVEACASTDGRAVVVEIANATITLAYFLHLSPLAKRGRTTGA